MFKPLSHFRGLYFLLAGTLFTATCCAKPHKQSLLEPKEVACSAHTPSKDPHIITQKDLPFTIEESGEYELGQNLTFREEGAAITIAFAHNVKLRFKNFSIKLGQPEATGIAIHDSTEVTIENDAIKHSCEASQGATGTGISVTHSRKIVLSDLFLVNNGYGLIVDNSQDVVIRGSDFLKANIAGALVKGSTNVVFAHCVFSDNRIGLVWASATKPNQDGKILDCSFPNATGLTNLLAQQINGLMISGSSFSSAGGTLGVTRNLAQLGDLDAEAQCNDVRIQDVTFISRSENNRTLEGLALINGSGFLLDSAVFDTDNTGETLTGTLAGLHIGTSQGITYSNGIIRNIIVQGSPLVGIFLDQGTSGIIFEDSLVTGALTHGILFSKATLNSVQESTIRNNDKVGILVKGSSSLNALLYNTVQKNTIGIQIEAGSSNNTIQNSTIFGNSTSGISDAGTGSQIWNNTAFNNNSQNYITPLANPAVVVSPGATALTGQNIKGN
jgi:parallel beta-helix repeat protein